MSAISPIFEYNIILKYTLKFQNLQIGKIHKLKKNKSLE